MHDHESEAPNGNSGCGGLCRRLGHDCGDPGAGAVRPGWAAWHDRLAAATGLLERWLPAPSAADGSVWRLSLAHGKVREPPSPDREVWTPSAQEAAHSGGYPLVVVDAETDLWRCPSAAEPVALTCETEDEDRDGGQLGDRVAQALSATLDPLGYGLPPRVALLVRHTAGLLVSDAGHDVVRLAVADRPNGEAVDGELHLLFRREKGKTTRLALVPVRPNDAVRHGRPDPACVLAGHRGCAELTEEDHRRAEFRTRIACTTAVLSDFLYLNNNDAMSFGVGVETHGLDLSADPDAADRAFRAWMRGSRLWAGLHEEAYWFERLWEDDGDAPTRLDADGYAALVAAVRDELVQGSLHMSGWTEDAGPVDPDAYLFPWVLRDFFAELADRVCGASGVPRLAYGTGLPFGYFGDYEGNGDDYGFLVLVGPERMAVVTIDARV